MRILDSNIIIYAAQPRHGFLRQMITEQKHFVSDITKLEVLGYHKLTEKDRNDLAYFFDVSRVINISPDLIEKAITLRQSRRMSLADAIIAATALVNNLTLVTRNTADFKNIPGLKLFNPFKKPKQGV